MDFECRVGCATHDCISLLALAETLSVLRGFISAAMHLKLVTLSSFGHGKYDWSRLSERDKF